MAPIIETCTTDLWASKTQWSLPIAKALGTSPSNFCFVPTRNNPSLALLATNNTGLLQLFFKINKAACFFVFLHWLLSWFSAVGPNKCPLPVPLFFKTITVGAFSAF